MPKSKQLILVFVVIIVLIISLKTGLFRINDVSDRIKQEDIVILDTLLFESGDVLMRHGDSFISDYIAKSFPESHSMSHCGILVQDEGVWKVIHSISGQISGVDGIRIEKANSFMANASNNNVILVKPKFHIDKQLISQLAWKYLKLKPEFDHAFNLNDRSKLYCSELVRAVYLEAGTKDIFIYKTIAGKKIIDFKSFFSDQYWSY